MVKKSIDPAVIRDQLLAAGVIQEDERREPTRRWTRPKPLPGESHARPEAIYAALVDAGMVEPPVVEPQLQLAHPADLVEWAIANWWPGYLATFDVRVDNPTDLEAGVELLARHLSFLDPETTPGTAAALVRLYVYEGAMALLDGRPPPASDDEEENRLQILRGITNNAALAAYNALVGPPPPADLVNGPIP